MQRFKMTLAYEGTNFGGWQVQSNAPSIQKTVQEALSCALRTPTSLTGAARTDSGVHALAQVAHFDHPTLPDTLLPSLNGLLPKEIRILSITPVDSSFHARYSATAKTYTYRLHLGAIPDPFTRHHTYHVPYPLSLPLIEEAARHLIGTHDFTSFANHAHTGAASRDPIRTLTSITITPTHFIFTGNGFLYKMVRNLVGTLIDIGRNQLTNLPAILAAKDRSRAGHAAPPHALFLTSVHYN